jgi:probable O-glycosylation ligase (exosortase A-associated)
MLRIIFVVAMLLIGTAFALQSTFYALLFYLWIAYFRPENWVWTNVFFAIPTSFVVGVYLLIRAVLSGVPLRLNVRTGLLFALLFLGILSTFNSNHFTWSVHYLQDFGKALIVTYLISVLASDIRHLRMIIIAICFSVSFEAAKQGWAQLILNPGGTNANEIVYFGDNNAVAVGVLMIVPMLVALARTATTKHERYLHIFLAVGMLYRAISTYSRGGFLAAAAMGSMYLWRSPHRVRTLIGGALAATLVLSVMPPEFWDRMSTITVEEGERDGSANGRIHFWRTALLMVQDRPLLGVGTNAFNEAYPTYDTSSGAYGLKRSVHNAWLGILAELGYPGFVLFCGSVFFAAKSSNRARRLAKKGLISPDLGHFGTALESALVAFAVGSSFVIFQYTELLWHVIGMSIAVHYLTEQELGARRNQAPTITQSAIRQPLPHTFRPVRRPAAAASVGRARL